MYNSPTIDIATPYGRGTLVVRAPDKVSFESRHRDGHSLNVFRVDYNVSAYFTLVNGAWTIERISGSPLDYKRGYEISPAANRELERALPLVVATYMKKVDPAILRQAEMVEISFARNSADATVKTATEAIANATAQLAEARVLLAELASREQALHEATHSPAT